MSDERFAEENNKLENQLKELEGKIKKFNEDIIQKSKETVDKFDFAAHAKQRYDTGDIAEKRNVLTELGSNFVLIGKNLIIELPEIFIAIQNMKKSEPLAGRLVEPGDQRLTKAQLTTIYSNNPAVLRD